MPPTSETAADDVARARGAKRRAKTRSAALDAVERLLVEHTPADLRMEDVATEAGIAPASLYTHFGTKNGLLAATVDRLMEVSAETMRGAYAGSGTPLERIQATGIAYFELLLAHPALIRLFAAGGLERMGATIADASVSRFGRIRVEFEKAIADAAAVGDSPVDARLMSYFLFGAWNGVAELTVRTDQLGISVDDARAAIAQAAAVIVRGFVDDGHVTG